MSNGCAPSRALSVQKLHVLDRFVSSGLSPSSIPARRTRARHTAWACTTSRGAWPSRSSKKGSSILSAKRACALFWWRPSGHDIGHFPYAPLVERAASRPPRGPRGEMIILIPLARHVGDAGPTEQTAALIDADRPAGEAGRPCFFGLFCPASSTLTKSTI